MTAKSDAKSKMTVSIVRFVCISIPLMAFVVVIAVLISVLLLSGISPVDEAGFLALAAIVTFGWGCIISIFVEQSTRKKILSAFFVIFVLICIGFDALGFAASVTLSGILIYGFCKLSVSNKTAMRHVLAAVDLVLLLCLAMIVLAVPVGLTADGFHFDFSRYVASLPKIERGVGPGAAIIFWGPVLVVGWFASLYGVAWAIIKRIKTFDYDKDLTPDPLALVDLQSPLPAIAIRMVLVCFLFTASGAFFFPG